MSLTDRVELRRFKNNLARFLPTVVLAGSACYPAQTETYFGPVTSVEETPNYLVTVNFRKIGPKTFQFINPALIDGNSYKPGDCASVTFSVSRPILENPEDAAKIASSRLLRLRQNGLFVLNPDGRASAPGESVSLSRIPKNRCSNSSK